jgi:phosphate-selective porin OprO/OprP
VARYTQLNMDKNVFNGFSDGTTSAGDAYAWSAGINWWLNRNVRILTSFSQTTFQGGGGINLGVPSTQAPPATVAHQNEYVLFTRIQIAF